LPKYSRALLVVTWYGTVHRKSVRGIPVPKADKEKEKGKMREVKKCRLPETFEGYLYRVTLVFLFRLLPSSP